MLYIGYDFAAKLRIWVVDWFCCKHAVSCDSAYIRDAECIDRTSLTGELHVANLKRNKMDEHVTLTEEGPNKSKILKTLLPTSRAYTPDSCQDIP
jgi:hypothetical protein